MGGAVLINKSTGKPEWVAGNKIEGALASGTYYSKTGKVNIQSDATGKVYQAPVRELQENINQGAAPVSEAKLYTAKKEAERNAAVDNAWDKVVTFGEGLASSLTLGAADILMDDETTRRRANVNSGWRTFGEVTGMVAPAFLNPASLAAQAGKTAVKEGGESLLKRTVAKALAATPSGIASRLSAGAGKSLTKGLADGATKRIAAVAMEGVVEGAIWSTGNQLSDAIIEEKPFSAESLLADMTLGGVIGGGFGAVGQGMKAIKSAREARAMRAANPLFDLSSDVSKQFRQQIVGSVDDAIKYGDNFKKKMDAIDLLELHGVEAANIKPRRAMFKEYKKAKEDVRKLLGLSLEQAASGEEMEVALSKFLKRARQKDMLKFVKRLDDLHARTADLDELLRPMGEKAPKAKTLLDESPQLELLKPGGGGKQTANVKVAQAVDPYAKTNPDMFVPGAPQAQAPWHAKYAQTSPPVGEQIGVGRIMGSDSPEYAQALSGKTLKGSDAAQNAASFKNASDTIPGQEAAINAAAHTPPAPKPQGTLDAAGLIIDEQPWGMRQRVDMAEGNLDKYGNSVGRSPKDINAGIQISESIRAKAIAELNAPLPGFSGSKPFAERIDELGHQLGDKLEGKISAIDALAIADLLGVDMDKVPVVGPVASSVLNLWLFYRLGSQFSGQAGKAARGKNGIARYIASNALARKGGEIGRKRAGALGAGAMYAGVQKGVQAAWDGVGNIGASTGRMANRVSEVVGKVLTPTFKAAVKKRVPAITGLNAAVGPTLDSDPKDDYGRIAAQLGRTQDEKAMTNWLNTEFEDFRILDPGTADEMVKAKLAQYKYLYSKMPQQPINWPAGVRWTPKPSEWIPFKETMAVYYNGPDILMKAFEDGHLTENLVADTKAMWRASYDNLTDAVITQMVPQELTVWQRKNINMLLGAPSETIEVSRFTQEQYKAARNKKESQQSTIAGANQVSAGIPLPGQQYGAGASINNI